MTVIPGTFVASLLSIDCARDLLFGALLAISPHPIHTTVLELKWDTRTNAIQGTLRVFEDDLLTASKPGSVAAYVLRNVELTAGGKPSTLETCGERRAGDAVLICLRGTAATSAAWRIRNTLLMERYEDQVNVVRVDTGKPKTLLLTNRASSQSIP
jgi:hypothetical protein